MPAASYTPREEFAHAITHGIGILLGIVGLILMMVKASQFGDAWHITSTAIFGVSMVLLYAASTAYHAVSREPLKALLRKIDHGAIFVLIAGTYTPFLLVTLRGAWGWSLFGVVWGLGILGLVLKFWFTGRFRVVSTLLFLIMGWLIIIAVKPLVAALPTDGFKWLLIGGLSYSLGTVFYLWKKLPYNHAIWHLCVLGGTIGHWIAIYYYVIPSV